jgi:signal transduction histidine kinase
VVRAEEGLPRIMSDVDLLRRVLDTLLSNAVRFTPPDGRIDVVLRSQPGRRARDPHAWLCVDVCDEGPGLRDQEQVFDDAARAEALAASPGFRLPIARRIARLLGGDLTLESSDHHGCRFTMWLPQPAAVDQR